MPGFHMLLMAHSTTTTTTTIITGISPTIRSSTTTSLIRNSTREPAQLVFERTSVVGATGMVVIGPPGHAPFGPENEFPSGVPHFEWFSRPGLSLHQLSAPARANLAT